jgi:hypothetical protein
MAEVRTRRWAVIYGAPCVARNKNVSAMPVNSLSALVFTLCLQIFTAMYQKEKKNPLNTFLEFSTAADIST